MCPSPTVAALVLALDQFYRISLSFCFPAQLLLRLPAHLSTRSVAARLRCLSTLPSGKAPLAPSSPSSPPARMHLQPCPRELLWILPVLPPTSPALPLPLVFSLWPRLSLSLSLSLIPLRCLDLHVGLVSLLGTSTLAAL